MLEEISPETGISAYIHRFYYVGNYIDPDRSGIKKFVKSIFGNNYTESWHYNKHEIEGINYYGISRTTIDLERAQAWPNILDKINEIKEIRKDTYPNLVKISFEMQGQEKNITDLERISDCLINKKITYENLYYTYVLKHKLETMQIFQDKPEGTIISSEWLKLDQCDYQEQCVLTGENDHYLIT